MDQANDYLRIYSRAATPAPEFEDALTYLPRKPLKLLFAWGGDF